MGQLTGDLASLVRKDSELIRAEASKKLHAATRAVADIAAGRRAVAGGRLAGAAAGCGAGAVASAGAKTLKAEIEGGARA